MKVALDGHGQAELRENFLMRDRLAMLKPFAGLGDGFAFGIAQGVPVVFRRDHGFEQMNHGGELPWVELIEQLMGELLIDGHVRQSSLTSTLPLTPPQ